MTSTTFLSAALCLLVAPLLACRAPRGSKLDYPEAPRSEQADDYFGTSVADPYRWLEALVSEATAGFVERQNALAQPYLEGLPARRRIAERMRELWRYERYGVPRKRGGRYFFEHNRGDQEQDVLMVAGSADGEPRVLIDPNTFREDATISLANFEASPDGALVAWAVSDGGTDFRVWKIRDVDSGDDLADELRQMKFSDVSWTPDSAGFYYSRYPVGGDGEADDSKQVSVFHHRLGTPQSDDRHVYSVEDDDGQDPYCQISDDGRFLIFSIFEGYSANAVHVRDLEAEGSPTVPIPGSSITPASPPPSSYTRTRLRASSR